MKIKMKEPKTMSIPLDIKDQDDDLQPLTKRSRLSEH